MAGPSASAEAPNEHGLISVKVTGLVKMPGWTFRVTIQPPSIDPKERRHPARQIGEIGITPPSESEIKPEQFRRIPIGEVLRLAKGVVTSPMLSMVAEMVGAEIGSRPYGGGIEHSRALATIYRTALSQDLSPLDAIAEVYGVSQKTVSRWLSEARKTTDPKTKRKVLGSYRDELAEHGFTAAMKKMNSPKSTGSSRGKETDK